MPLFLYTVWFRDQAADPADQDHEWPACLLIKAETPEAARAWGDRLARARAGRAPAALYLHAEVEVAPEPVPARVPRLRDGEEMADEVIGW